ncbi:MAG: hypothetical protein JW787_03780 [Sedimentisphaerales bacterium]|nr:hypothetical protein [Sedimentisphaerales bacterium]
MTEELEKKLNELLGFKKQLEVTAEQSEKNTLSVLEQYKKEAKRTRIRSFIALIIGTVFLWFGACGLGSTEIIIFGHDISGTQAQYALGGTFILLGIFLISLSLLASCIRESKLQILAELKQFELRITEMLKN